MSRVCHAYVMHILFFKNTLKERPFYSSDVTYAWHTFFVSNARRRSAYVTRVSRVCHGHIFFSKTPSRRDLFFKWCDIMRDILFLYQILEEGARMSQVCHAHVMRNLNSKTQSRRGLFFVVRYYRLFFFKCCDIRVTYAWHTFFGSNSRRRSAYVTRVSRVRHAHTFFQKHPQGEAFLFKWCDIRVTYFFCIKCSKKERVCHACVTRMSWAHIFFKNTL